jgi:hypothetical protein
MKYKILEDIISKNLQEKIKNTLTENNFPWYLVGKYENYLGTVSRETNFLNKDENTYEYLQLNHNFYLNENGKKIQNSVFSNLILDVLNEAFNIKLEVNSYEILKAKANFKTQCKKSNIDKYNTPHVDLKDSHVVFIYYVEDSDGYTFLFDKDKKIIDKILPKQGRGLIFDGSILHAASHPINYETRIVLNIDLKINYEKDFFKIF